MIMQMDEIKVCPFCGKPPLVYKGPDNPGPHEAGSWIMCRTSGCVKPAIYTTTDAMGNQGSMADILPVWNTRYTNQEGC